MARSLGLPVLLCCALAALLASAAPASARQFRVGGQKGWGVQDAGDEPYNAWSGRLRFLIGDQLLFVYPKATDSVLVVDAAAYNACNTSSYISRFDDGSTVFTFDRSGPFYFISGNQANCRANEKLIVLVLADRSGTHTPPGMMTPPPSSAPAPPAMTPPPSSSPAPPAMTPPPSSAPPAASPSSPSAPPASSPSSPPSGAAPLPAPAATPTTSPPLPAPAATPTTSPPTASSPPMPAPTTAPMSSPPAPAPPPSTTTGGASQPPSGSANAPGGGGGGSTTPPPSPSAAATVAAGFVGSLASFVGYAMLAA